MPSTELQKGLSEALSVRPSVLLSAFPVSLAQNGAFIATITPQVEVGRTDTRHLAQDTRTCTAQRLLLVG